MGLRAALASLAFLFALAWSPAVFGQQGQAPSSSQVPPQPDQPITFEDQVVVSASRAEEELINAPATVSVISAQSIQTAPR